MFNYYNILHKKISNLKYMFLSQGFDKGFIALEAMYWFWKYIMYQRWLQKIYNAQALIKTDLK